MPSLSEKGGAQDSEKSLCESMTYIKFRPLTPVSLLASMRPKQVLLQSKRNSMTIEKLTYKSIISSIERQVESGQLNANTAKNQVTALRKFLMHHHINEENAVGSEFRDDFLTSVEASIAILLNEGKTGKIPSNFKSVLKKLRNHVVLHDTAVAAAAGGITPFTAAVIKVIGDIRTAKLADTIGMPRLMLAGWKNGSLPRPSSLKYVRRLERYFGIPENELVSLGLNWDTPYARAMRAPHIEYRERYKLQAKQRVSYRPAIGSRVREQWMGIMKFKTARALPPGMKRNVGSTWRLAAKNFERQTEANWFAFLGNTEVPTAKSCWHYASAFLSWIGLSVEEGGVGVPPEDLDTLAWLMVPGLSEQFTNWWIQRNNGLVSGAIFEHISLVACLARQNEGYFYQLPELKYTLPKHYHNRSWIELCDDKHSEVMQLKISYRDSRAVSRDPFEPLRDVLSLDEPMEAIADMFVRMRANRPIQGGIDEAAWGRDICMLSVLVSNPLRAKNMAQLTWKKDNSGELYKRQDGSWWIRVPKIQLKNPNGAMGAAKNNERYYEAPVIDKFWKDIERYLTVYRPRLLKGETDFVFVSSANRDKGDVPWRDFSKRVHLLTKRYIPNCPGFGAHAFRHIVATSILKAQGGDIKTAALVLNDRQDTVERSYAHLRNGEGHKQMGELLGKSFKRF